MGLDIPSIPVVNGLAIISNAYGHVRDIRINKNANNKYIVECLFYVYKNDIVIDTMFITKEYDTDFLTKTWEDVYTMVKEYLDTKSIGYVNNI